MVVENRPGGGTVIGTAAVASAHPDGYTLLLVSPAHTINPHIHKTLPFDPLADFTPIAQITRSAYVLVTAANSPIGSVGDLIASARHRDAPFTYASSGTGSAPHLAGHLLAHLSGVKAIHVPYLGGSPAMVGVIRGDIDVYLSSLSSRPHLPRRSQTGIADYAVNGWYGVIGPAGLPIEIVTRLEDGIHRSLQDPELVDTLEREGEEVSTGTPDAFAALIRNDLERYRTIVKSAGLTPQITRRCLLGVMASPTPPPMMNARRRASKRWNH